MSLNIIWFGNSVRERSESDENLENPASTMSLIKLAYLAFRMNILSLVKIMDVAWAEMKLTVYTASDNRYIQRYLHVIL